MKKIGVLEFCNQLALAHAEETAALIGSGKLFDSMGAEFRVSEEEVKGAKSNLYLLSYYVAGEQVIAKCVNLDPSDVFAEKRSLVAMGFKDYADKMEALS